jgi:hypothetical protein
MNKEANAQKNTLLKNAQANPESIFLREYFFRHPKKNFKNFSPTRKKN